MSLGKPAQHVMAETVFRYTGKRDPGLLTGPRRGMDVAVLRIRKGTLLIASADPVSFIPALGPFDSAWLSVHSAASDVATSGIAPSHAIFELNLPPEMLNRTLKAYWMSIHEICRDLAITIVGGHTGRFQGCDYTIVGGVTMWGFAQPSHYVTSASGRDGDDIIATKSAAVEATAVLARTFPRSLEKALGRNVVLKAKALLRKTSVVEDARVAATGGIGRGGVTAMHDATEGGILTSILELAEASSLGVTVQAESIPILDEARDVCSFFHIDPLISLGQGSLIIASRPLNSEKILKALDRRGIHAGIVGRLSRRRTSRLMLKGGARKLRYPKFDPYWQAYWNGVKRRLS